MMFQPESNLPLAIPGFEHIRRAYLHEFDSVVAKVLPGEWYVTKNAELISTVLGSCVAACIRDPQTGVGGMNHFMLPADKNNTASPSLMRNKSCASYRYGAPAMDALIQTILRHGGVFENLEVKLFGGGQVLDFEQMQVGDANADFARNYVQRAGLRLLAEDLGTVFARRVIFDPLTGKVRVRRLRRTQATAVTTQEQPYRDFALRVRP